jgi:hypothetical protein
MGVEYLAIFIPMIAIVSITVMIVYLRRFENSERMAMIEKGVSAELITSKKRANNSSGALRASLLLIGGGLGLMLGYFLDHNFDMEGVGYFSMLFIFGGIGLGLAYLVEEKKAAREEKR